MPQYLYAIFIDTADKKVRHLERWPMQVRRNRDGLDSEGRIFPLGGGNFVVLADNRLRLYSSSFELLHEIVLQNDGNDLWAAQVPPGGKDLFLRHDHLGTIEYLWLSSDALATIREEHVPIQTASEVRGPAIVNRNVVYVPQSADRLDAIFPSDASSVKCEVKACWHSTDIIPLSEDRMALAGGSGLAVYSQTGLCFWSLEVSGSRAPAAVAKASLDGMRFAVEMSGSGANFAGTKLGDNATFLVFDLDKPEPLLIAKRPLTPDYTFALDPHGSQLAVLTGTTLSLYAFYGPQVEIHDK